MRRGVLLASGWQREQKRRNRWRLRIVLLIISVILITSVVLLGWIFRPRLHKLVSNHPAVYPAAALFMGSILLGTAAVLWSEAEVMRRAWRSRVSVKVGLEKLVPQPLWRLITHRLPDPLEWISAPLWRSRFGQGLHMDWVDAEMGEKASRYLLLLLLSAFVGYFIGSRIAGAVLGIALALVLPLLPRSLVVARAVVRRRRFGEQLPQALDSIASGLSAGLSFQQAVEFSQEDLPDPARNALATLSRRITLGFSVDEALQHILDIHPDESLALVIDGLVLQRQFGGDIVGMLEGVAGVLRERLELEREVRAITTQGRLSGGIIAALVPVSAAFLLSFNPRYIDVLFDTLVGQILVVVAIVLQLVGWAVISRLVQVRY